MERWTQKQIEYLKNNYKSSSYKEIAKVIHKTEGSIRAKCFDLGIVKNNRWSDEEKLFLQSNYKYKTNKELANQFNRTEASIAIQLKKLGCKRELIQYNRLYFKDIDTEEKAYWLGFIYADGWVSCDDENRGCLGIELQRVDFEHLKKFNKSLNGNIEVKYRMSSVSHIDGREISSFPMCYIKLYSYEIVNDLFRHGVRPRKTYDMNFPNSVSDTLLRHFIRGYFDGNGCVTNTTHKNGKKYIKCDFSCHSFEFLKGLRDCLYQNNIKSYICNEKNNYRLYIGGLENTNNFLCFIYNNSTISLTRKQKKTEQLYKNLQISKRLPLGTEMYCL